MNALKIAEQDSSQNSVLIDNIRNLIHDRNIREVELSRQTNIPPATLHKILTGKTTDPRISTLQAIANYFGVTIDELYSGPQRKANVQSIPIISWQECLSASSFIDTLTPANWGQWLTIENTEDDIYGLSSQPCMEPRFPRGTILIIDSKIKAEDGDLVIVAYPGTEKATLREYSSDGPHQSLLSIKPNRPQEPLTEDTKIIGVVVESRFSHHLQN